MKLFSHLIATAFGVGYLPKCPGTWGSLLGLGIALLMGTPVLIAATLVLIFLGVWASHATALQLQKKDPSEVVIDEVVGMMLALLFLPKTWLFIILAFGLFRLFDIKKPSFIGRAEKLPGGWGIMMDDVLAGIVTNLILQVGHLIYLSVQVYS
jgi:phosphatidylglycerophosphatase A